MSIDIIVFFRKSDLEFKDSIRKGPSSDENDSVEVAQIVQGGYQIDPTGSMLFQMFVFNRYLVVTEGLFALFLQVIHGRVGSVLSSSRFEVVSIGWAYNEVVGSQQVTSIKL